MLNYQRQSINVAYNADVSLIIYCQTITTSRRQCINVLFCMSWRAQRK